MKNRYASKKNRNKFNNPEKNKSILAICIICIALALIGVFVYAYHSASKEIDEIDASNFCRKDNPRTITVILIDHTDTLNVMQRTSLETRLWDVAKSIPKNSIIKVYSVGRVDENALTPEIEQCNPGSKADVNDITGNKSLAEAKYEKNFKTPIKNILSRVMNEKGGHESPIMESLQSVNVTAFIGEKNKNAKKRLILVSDLLQNSDRFSIYKGVPDFNTYINSEYWMSIKSDFSDVDVKIFFLHRNSENKLQNTSLIKFWLQYFGNQHAIVSEILHVEG